MHGEEYDGYEKESSGNKRAEVKRPARTMKEPCNSNECRKRKCRYCAQFTEDQRTIIFANFWKCMDWGQRKAFVISMVDQHKARRSTAPSQSRKTETFHYFLKLNNTKREVCKKMFLHTLGIGRTQLHNWIKTKNLSRKPRNVKKYVPSDKKTRAKKFLEDLPKLPSHYCRKDSAKLYLEPVFTTKRELYRCYLDLCKSKEQEKVSWYTFSSLLEEMNISLYRPRKDKCDICCSYEAGNLEENVWTSHTERYKAARSEKEADKNEAFIGKCHALVMDVESVHVAPLLTASALYYKTKLLVHNFTVYDLVTRETTCYLWDESEGDLSASVFATCLIDFLKSYKDTLPVIIWSDGCVSQNRNSILSTALLDYAIRNEKVVIQKILERGHTQMEVDSVHSAIERKLKGKVIYVPSDYVKICREARIDPKPYNVKYMTHKYFLDFSGHENQRYTSIRPGNKTGDACVTDLRQIRYNFNNLGELEFKLDFGPEWKDMPRKANEAGSEFPKLFPKRLPITKRKHKDLQDLLHVIPSDHHTFYNLLTTN